MFFIVVWILKQMFMEWTIENSGEDIKKNS